MAEVCLPRLRGRSGCLLVRTTVSIPTAVVLFYVMKIGRGGVDWRKFWYPAGVVINDICVSRIFGIFVRTGAPLRCDWSLGRRSGFLNVKLFDGVRDAGERESSELLHYFPVCRDSQAPLAFLYSP